MDDEYALHKPTYETAISLFSHLRKILGINLKLHGDPSLLTQGEIFLFNHFARIETFLPHYLIYQETGAYCRAIAASDLFEGSETFSDYLKRLGVLPNNHNELLPILVAEIIRGRKVVIFPEGGMVKDRRVLDDKGKYRIYSRTAKAYRKHHAGAAVLAIAVDTFKLAVLSAEKEQNWQRLDEWVDMLKLDNLEHLIFAARRPTYIVPGNITFYPINTNENFFHKTADFLGVDLSARMHEELLIEANLLLKHTDMDMRLGQAINLVDYRPWWERKILAFLAVRLTLIEDFFTLKTIKKPWLEKLTRWSIRRSSERLRDQYMKGIYRGVTVNLSHLASVFLLHFINNGQTEVDIYDFYQLLYSSVKYLQKRQSVHLHRSLRNPEIYSDLAIGRGKVLKQFFELSSRDGLLVLEHGRLKLFSKLQKEFEFDTVRIENTIQVYANEVGPIREVAKAVDNAFIEKKKNDAKDWAAKRFDDELRSYEWNQVYYSKPRFDDINLQEKATESGRPFMLFPASEPASMGVVIVHGFMASPAEVRPFADKLVEQGFAVIGVRLPGHGTSPVDLRERCWEDWLRAVQHSYEIISAYVDNVSLVGFSTGGSLAMVYASEHPPKLASTIVINPPMKFRSKNMIFVPLLHNVSKLVRWASSLEGVMPFRVNETEHGRINYHNMPVRGLHELRRMNHVLKRQLRKIQSPTLIVHSTGDPVISSDSAQNLLDDLVNSDAILIEIESDRHGILYEDVGKTHEHIQQFLSQQLTSAST